MRHATVQAIRHVSGIRPVVETGALASPETAACDWAQHAPNEESFGLSAARALVVGAPAELPTCPTCALFVDLALLESGLTCGENVEATCAT